MSNYDSKPDIVRQTQTAINAAGYMPPLTVDGTYGPKTKAGIIWFQGQHNLAQDGIIGDQTLAATIASPPGGGTGLVGSGTGPAPNDPLAGIRSIVASIKQMQQGGSAPLPASPPLIAVPVTALRSKVLALRLGAPPPAGASAPYAPTSPVLPSLPSSVPTSKAIPAAIGAGAGIALGFVFGPPLGKLIGVGIGALAGVAAGVAYAMLNPGPAAAPSIAGEVSFGFEEDGFDLGEDFVIDDESGEIVAGDIGVASSYGTLRG